MSTRPRYVCKKGRQSFSHSGTPNRRRSISHRGSVDLHGGSNDCIKVMVRVRPQNPKEDEAGHNPVVQVVDSKLLIFDPKEEPDDFFFQGKKQFFRDLSRKVNKAVKFTFDYVFEPEMSNQEVFENTTKDIVGSILNGINCSVFAYGATGAGKTFTMLGTPDNPGITFLTVKELCDRIDSMTDKSCDVSVSYLEVYNELVRDLLQNSPPLAVREDGVRGIVVSGLSTHKPRDPHHILELLHLGNQNRTQHPTDANAESSRSHAVFQVHVTQRDKTAGLSTNVKTAKLSLIDLAGSERAAIVAKKGARFREGASINKSLLALGNCINALADNKKKKLHIPYRDSNLTRILKDSLGGNCRTVMIAAISESHLSYEDTYNTLKYADRAKNIQLMFKSNVVNVNAHLTEYSKIVQDLKNEIETLKAKLQSSEGNPSSKNGQDLTAENDALKAKLKFYESNSNSNVIQDLTTENVTLKAKLKFLEENPPCVQPEPLPAAVLHIFNQHKLFNQQLLKCESSLRLLEAKLKWRSDFGHRICPASDKKEKNEETLKAMEEERSRILLRKASLEKQVHQSLEQVQRVEPMLGKPGINTANPEIQRFHDEVKFQVSESTIEHLQQLVIEHDKWRIEQERLLCASLPLLEKQQLILKAHNFLTKDLEMDYNALLKKNEGTKEVVWADQATQSVEQASEFKHLISLPSWGTPVSSPVGNHFIPVPLITFLNASAKKDDERTVMAEPGVKIEKGKVFPSGSPHPKINRSDQENGLVSTPFAGTPNVEQSRSQEDNVFYTPPFPVLATTPPGTITKEKPSVLNLTETKKKHAPGMNSTFTQDDSSEVSSTSFDIRSHSLTIDPIKSKLNFSGVYKSDNLFEKNNTAPFVSSSSAYKRKDPVNWATPHPVPLGMNNNVPPTVPKGIIKKATKFGTPASKYSAVVPKENREASAKKTLRPSSASTLHLHANSAKKGEKRSFSPRNSLNRPLMKSKSVATLRKVV